MGRAIRVGGKDDAVIPAAAGKTSGGIAGYPGAASALRGTLGIAAVPAAGMPAGAHCAAREAGTGAPSGGQPTWKDEVGAGGDWPAQMAAESIKTMEILEIIKLVIR
jgi:hypothetical protein